MCEWLKLDMLPPYLAELENDGDPCEKRIEFPIEKKLLDAGVGEGFSQGIVGTWFGASEGALDGATVGAAVGSEVGVAVGEFVGSRVGPEDGAAVGTSVGAEVVSGVTSVWVRFPLRAKVVKWEHPQVTASLVYPGRTTQPLEEKAWVPSSHHRHMGTTRGHAAVKKYLPPPPCAAKSHT